jgi:hypothetical protein
MPIRGTVLSLGVEADQRSGRCRERRMEEDVVAMAEEV